MIDTRAFDEDRTSGPLRSCGRCVNTDHDLTLAFDCAVHGRLAEWAADNSDQKIVEKVTEAAADHERAALMWVDMTDSVARLFERMAKGLRRDDR
jgi:hypothetical protein